MERNAEPREVGGISLWPNATKALRKLSGWGVEPLDSISLVNQVKARCGAGMETFLSRTPVRELQQRFRRRE